MKLILSLSILSLIGCASGSYKDKSSDWEKVYAEKGWSTKDKAVEIKSEIKLKPGETLDCGGKIYRWVGAKANSCHAKEEISETMPRMIANMPKGSKIRNCVFECMLEGVKMGDDTEISNSVWRDVEEDAITTNGKNNVIRNNKFYLANDKTIQMNEAQDILIEGNEFYHSGRAISGSARDIGAQNVRFYNNKMVNVEVGIRAQANHTIYAKGNSLNGGRNLFETTSDRSVIYDCSGNTVSGGAERLSKNGTNNVKDKKDCK